MNEFHFLLLSRRVAHSQVSFGHTKIGLRYDYTLNKARPKPNFQTGTISDFTNEFSKTRSRHAHTEACFMMSNLLSLSSLIS